MFGIGARFVLLCTLTAIATACTEEAAPKRGNAQPGETCASTNECAIGFQCTDDVCGQADPLRNPYRITLTWEANTDFDLHVRTEGQELYFDRENTFAWLGSDDCASETCIEDDTLHAEHAFLRNIVAPDDMDAGQTIEGEDGDGGTDDGIAPGTIVLLQEYEYWVDNYGCQKAGDFTLAVIAANERVIESHTGTLEARCMESEHFVSPLLPFPQTP